MVFCTAPAGLSRPAVRDDAPASCELDDLPRSASRGAQVGAFCRMPTAGQLPDDAAVPTASPPRPDRRIALLAKLARHAVRMIAARRRRLPRYGRHARSFAPALPVVRERLHAAQRRW
jgi:hypothetical protein